MENSIKGREIVNTLFVPITCIQKNANVGDLKGKRVRVFACILTAAVVGVYVCITHLASGRAEYTAECGLNPKTSTGSAVAP